ncbi:MAG TPA: hypothetical protein VES68_03175 [Candidatus Sulfotelmatobacter sp.]|nr:hypothetical protein [Candidatus Sulfotelmatobacter sp.]
MSLILLPLYILKFWYLEAPIKLLRYFFHLNKAFFNLFSLPLMIKTFFRPWKNEYREGLVKFSIFMGMVFKTMFIVADLFILFFLILFEVIVFMGFLAWPVLAFYLPFIKI